MGISTKEFPTNLLMNEKYLLYHVPEQWTLEEAATVPLAYAISIYALIMVMLTRLSKIKTIEIYGN